MFSRRSKDIVVSLTVGLAILSSTSGPLMAQDIEQLEPANNTIVANDLGHEHSSEAEKHDSHSHVNRETPENMLLEAANSYASDYKVAIDEATRRLHLQDSLDKTISKLEIAVGDRFAGAWIEHEPNYRAVIRLVGDSKNAVQGVESIIGESAIPIVFVYGAKSTMAEMTGKFDSGIDQLESSYSQLVGSEIDVKTGEVVLFVQSSSDMEKTAELDTLEQTLRPDAMKNLKLPVRIETSDAQVGDGHTRGGAHLSSCTSGFVVKDSNNVRGYITAGHCGDSQRYYEYGGTNYSTEFIGEIRDSDQDVQWHTTSHWEYPHFYASSTSSYRTLQSAKSRSQQIVGSYVCHRGKTTGYSCGNIVSKTFRPTYANACNGVRCASVWIRVKGRNLKCSPGDSGGPWFNAYTAYGLHKGASSSGTSAGDCNWAFYSATNYFGISLVFD